MILTQEQFDGAYEKLPFAIREYLADDELASVTQEIGKKYGLHVDTVGSLERELTNMLLGLINPAQFVTELRSAGIAPESVGPITQETNEKIFIPLHKKIVEEGTSTKDPDEDESIEGKEALAPSVAAAISQSTPISAPTLPPTPVVQAYVPASPPPVVPSVIPTPPPAAPVAPRPVPTPVFSQVTDPEPAAEPEARTMASDMALVKSGGFHPQSEAAPSAPTDTWTPPVAPRAPQPSAPFVPQPTPTPLPPQAPAPVQPIKAPATPSENRDALHAVLKEYGVDPYREIPE